MIAFSIGNIDIYRYGIFYLISFLVWYLFLGRVGKTWWFSKSFPWTQKMLTTELDTLMITLILSVIIGGRLGFVLLYWWGYYLQNPAEIFAIWHGGMAFFWGILWVILGMLLLKKLYKLSWRDLIVLFDIILLIVPLGIILGRLGNFLNQEIYGIIVSTDMSSSVSSFLKAIWFIHIYPQVDQSFRFNPSFFSIVFEWLLIGIVLRVIAKKQWNRQKREPGMITGWFLILYWVVRFFLEYIRQDSQSEFFWPFSITQRLVLIVCIGWLVFIRTIKKKPSVESLI